MYTKKSVNCVIGSLGNYFSTLNPKFDSSFVFFLLEKMKFSYEKTGFLISDISLTHFIENSFNNIAEKFNLKSNLIKSKNRNLQNLIHKNATPFVCPIYIKNLTYHQLYKINKWDLSHFITILNIKNNDVLISDCYIPKINDGEIFEGKVKLKEIQSA